MAMKVGGINSLSFYGVQNTTQPKELSPNKPQIKELSNVTPDFGVRIPQKYTKTGNYTLSNGLNIYTYKLANGHKVSIIPMEGSPATVKNYVNVGSMNETEDIKGISHFLEHMAFNGTVGDNNYIKLNTGDSFKKIEELGGWTNASTNYAITDYVNSTPQLNSGDLEQQIKVLAAMTENLALTDEMIEKEKGPVCSEISMIMDDPKTIVLDQTIRSLFNIKNSADEMVGGSIEHIKNLNRDKVKSYYDKYYTPDNMNLVITGDVDPDKAIELVAKNFHSAKKKHGKPYDEKLTATNKPIRKDFISDKADSTNIVLGFAGAENKDAKAEIIYDIVEKYLYSTETGIQNELKKYNTGMLFGMEKISSNPSNPTFLYMALSCHEQNSEEVLKTLHNKISNLKAPDEQTLSRIKKSLSQNYKEVLDYSSFVNDLVGRSVLNNSLDSALNYEKILNSISTKDIQDYIDNYLTLDKAAISIVHPQTTKENIVANYNKVNNVNFKGHSREPLNTQKISTQTLNNNIEAGFYSSKNNNIHYKLNFYYDMPQDIKPATRKVLSKIYSYGTMDFDENKIQKFKEVNDITEYSTLSADTLSIYGFSSSDNAEKSIRLAKNILNKPRITQKELDKAVSRLKDTLSRAKYSSERLYAEYESQNNPSFLSLKELEEDLDNVTLEDVQNLHNYIMNNSSCTLSVNIPENNPEIKNSITEEFSAFNNVKPHKYKNKEIYKQNLSPKVLTKEKEVSQADIMQTYKYNTSDDVKEIATAKIMNTILSSSHSIGLFNTLREKEHLAYSVHSRNSRNGNCGYLSCDILTTTDNKAAGEISYDNLQKSINGFHRQINCLLNSEYTDDDFESAKKILKANLLDTEGVDAKLSIIDKGLNSKYGTEYSKKLYDVIDTITREDVDKFAQKVFKNPPVYSIVASKDTLEHNAEYLKTLEQK